ncbi:MAG: 1-phosphofructokinase [Clostridiaceae bacterium]
MILTLTLNPAIDKTINISNFKLGTVNRVDNSRLDAGGKGINVSKVLKVLGGKSIALGILAGANGDFIKNHLDNENIENDFIKTKGETRVNLKIVDKINNQYTDINENFQVDESMFDLLKDKIISLLNKYKDEKNVVVLSGSIPKGLNTNIYKDLILDIKKTNAKVILDAEAELFTKGIEAAPYLIKPNIDELKATFNVTINNEDDIISVSRKIINSGVHIVVVSLGGEGSLLITKDEVLKVHGLKVTVKSTVGAGDSMVAALAFSLEQNYPLDQTLKLASAVSTANVMTDGTQTGKPEDIEKILNLVKIEKIN